MRTVTTVAALVVAAGLLSGCGGNDGLRHRRASAAAGHHALPPKLERVAPLDTEQVKAGTVDLASAKSLQLEATLQDLNRRKDVDAAANGGQPGPDAAYLSEWVEKVTQELLGRGYYVDAAGNLRRPGAVVAWR